MAKIILRGDVYIKRTIPVIIVIVLLLNIPALANVNFMAYMIGSDLEEDSGAASDDIAEMMRCEAAKDVNIYAVLGGARSWAMKEAGETGTTVLKIGKGGAEPIRYMEDCGIAREETLAQAISACFQTTPSEENILVIWGHGCEGTLGIGYDKQLDDDTLTLREIREGIINSGISIDILSFDACNMAREEVSEELKSCCGHLLASPQAVSLKGWPYHLLINALSGKVKDDCELICNIVNRHNERMGNPSELIQLF